MRVVAPLALGIAALATAGAAALPPTVASVRLPAGAIFGSVEARGGALLVSGTAQTGNDCAWTTVDPRSLRLGRSTRASCTRPVRAAHSFVPVLFRDPSSFEVRVRIARVRSGSKVSFGPVVMRLEESSDTHLEWTYGPRALWLFDTATPRGAEVLRVSTVTGRVEARVPMPRIFRPLLAANDDGLWLAIPPNGGFPGGAAAPIYRVSPGARAPVLVRRAGRAALWLAAAGRTAWADVVSGTSRQEVWRFDGPAGQSRALARADRLHASNAVLEPGKERLWAVSDVPAGGSFASCSAERVVTIDGRTGRRATVATLQLPGKACLYAGPGSTTFAFGAFYVVDPQSTPGVLFRIRP